MGFADAFKAIGGAVGGAARGAASAYPGIMLDQQRTRESGLRWADAQRAAEQRDRGLDLDERALAQRGSEQSWSRALEQANLRHRRHLDDMERIRVEGQINRDLMATREDATREEYGARMSRAQRAAAKAGPQMSQDQLDRIARLEGFTDYGQVVGVLQTAGRSVPEPGAVPNPGESGLDTINRIRGMPDFTSFSDRYQDTLLYDEVRRELGR